MPRRVPGRGDMNAKLINSESGNVITQPMITGMMACVLAGCLGFAVAAGLGAPAWLLLPLAAGCLIGSVQAVLRLRRWDTNAPERQAQQGTKHIPDRRFIVPLEVPSPPRNFVGRSHELRQMRQLVQSWTYDFPVIVAIVGESGLGKTTLAAQFAHINRDLFPDGQLFASLGHDDDCDSLTRHTLGQFISALQFLGDQVAESSNERVTLYSQLSATRKLLVILDDARHLECVARLLPSGAKCTVIVTSPEPIPGLSATEIIDLKPLSEREAIRLLESTLGRKRVQANPQAARQLVGTGHPLGIRLAATALSSRPHWPLEQAVTQITGQQSLQASNPGTGVNGELDLAYELMTREERRALRCIALLDEPVFAPWELAALLGVNEPDARLLAEQLNRMAVIRRTSGGRAGVVEYAIEDHVRQYLRMRIMAETTAVRREERLSALKRARDTRGRGKDMAYLLNQTIQAWKDAGNLGRALEAAQNAVAVTHRSGDQTVAALALATLADLQADIGNLEEAHTLAEAACRRVNGGVAPARALRCLGMISRRRGQIIRSEKILDRALSAARRTRDTPEEVRVLIEKAATFALTRDRTRAIAVADEAVALCQDPQAGGTSTHWVSLLVGALFARSNALLACGRVAQAWTCLAEAAETASEDQALWRAWIAWLRGHTALKLNDRRTAVKASVEAIDRFGAMSHRYGLGWSRLLLGMVYADAGSNHLDEAITTVNDALETLQDCSDRSAEAEAKRDLASLLARRGQERTDAYDFEEAARIFEDLGDESARLAAIRAELAALRPEPLGRRRNLALARRSSSPRRESN